MQGESYPIATGEKQEVQIPFPLARELFNTAEKLGLDAASYSEYVKNDIEDNANPLAISLPEKFLPFVAEYKGDYFIVAYENRTDPYYAKGTRYKEVLISNTDYRHRFNSLVREIVVKEFAVSEGKGNVLFISVSEKLNEQGFTSLNLNVDEKANLPHGESEATYKIAEDGTKKMITFESKRLDEEFFLQNGEEKLMRWLRKLRIEREGDAPTTTYTETYMIGLNPKGIEDARAMVQFTVAGDLASPQSILMEIGSGTHESAFVLYDDRERNTKILFHPPIREAANPLEVLKQDPNYSFLFDESGVDITKLQEVLQFKISNLRDDWDKPQSIFSKPESVTYSPPQIES